MPFLDRNSASPNRLRRNFQKFQASTGLNVPVNPTGGIINTSTGLAVNLNGPGSLLTVSTDGTTLEDLSIGPIGDVLTVLTASTIGWSTGGSGGGPFLPLAGGTMSGNIDMSTHAILRVQGFTDDATDTSILVTGRQLWDSTNFVTVDWNGAIETLYDLRSAEPSIEWGSRFLIDSRGGESLDWDNRFLYDSSGSLISINYQQRLLYASGGGGIVWGWSSTYPSTYVLAAPNSTSGLIRPRQLSTSDIFGFAGGSTYIYPIDGSISTSTVSNSTGLQVRLNAAGALSTTTTGLEVLVDNNTISTNGSDQLSVLLASDGGLNFGTGAGLFVAVDDQTVFINNAGNLEATSGVVGASFTSAAITNTTTLTQFTRTFVPSITAQYEVLNGVLKWRGWFTVSASTGDTLIIDARIGTTVVWGISTIPVGGLTSAPLLIELLQITTAAGGAGADSVMVTGQMFLNGLYSSEMIGPSTTTGLDLSGTPTFNFAAKWSAARTQDTITLNQAVWG